MEQEGLDVVSYDDVQALMTTSSSVMNCHDETLDNTQKKTEQAIYHAIT